MATPVNAETIVRIRAAAAVLAEQPQNFWEDYLQTCGYSAATAQGAAEVLLYTAHCVTHGTAPTARMRKEA